MFQLQLSLVVIIKLCIISASSLNEDGYDYDYNQFSISKPTWDNINVNVRPQVSGSNASNLTIFELVMLSKVSDL